MKKIYLKPEIDTTVVQLRMAVMSGFVDNTDPQQSQNTPQHPAPQKLF